MKNKCPTAVDDSNWQAESDARSLTSAQEIRADRKRYRLACTQLKKQMANASSALDMEAKVKKGLKEAFGSTSENQ